MAVNVIDANFGVFLVAVAICETECKDNWDNRRLTFITDRQKGVIDAIKTWWPGSSNRFCVSHIFANVRAKYRGNTSANLVFKAVKSTNKAEFEDAMKEIKDGDLDAYN
ncbi:hypothetical protein ACOSQ3_028977 [Xanthoceras sorbifolium]